jgi:2-amino-4-hydroxy-6-hydroxymethyldihydropteridine diphosphokinase
LTENRSKLLIALGGNLSLGGLPPQRALVQAIEMMPSLGMSVVAVSRFFATPCFPKDAGPDYVNAAVSVAASGNPHAVLAALHQIEAQFGRVRDQRWGMRTLDLDLLAIGQAILPDRATYLDWQGMAPEAQANAVPQQLIVPHPRLQDRAFVLVPMADIAPDWLHPVLNQTTAQLCAALPRADVITVRPI